MKEIWKPIEQSDGYEISNRGNLRRNKRTLKISEKTVYKIVRIKINGKYTTRYIHRLVAEAFLSRANGRDFINHIDGNKHNNSVNNLEWVTRQENELHAWEHGLKENVRAAARENAKTARRCANTNKPVRQFDIDMNLLHEWKSQSDAMRATGIDSSGIAKCCKGKLKKAGGYIWRYAG